MQSSKCKQKHGLRFVYITGNCELCIMLLTRRLTLKFLMTRRTVSLKHCKYQKRKHYLFFDQDRDHCSLMQSKLMFRVFSVAHIEKINIFNRKDLYVLYIRQFLEYRITSMYLLLLKNFVVRHLIITSGIDEIFLYPVTDEFRLRYTATLNCKPTMQFRTLIN